VIDIVGAVYILMPSISDIFIGVCITHIIPENGVQKYRTDTKKHHYVHFVGLKLEVTDVNFS
jgi:hypothetical protein